VRVRFRRLADDAAIELPPDAVSVGEVRATLSAAPPGPAAWAAGPYAASLVYRTAADPQGRSSNELPMALAPRLDQIQKGAATPDGAGGFDVTLTVACTPPVLKGQTVLLLLGGLAVPPRKDAGTGASLPFDAAGAPAGSYFLRLRVDGVDSLVVSDYDAPQPAFDASQGVTIP
jgi:hypothetical protein